VVTNLRRPFRECHILRCFWRIRGRWSRVPPSPPVNSPIRYFLDVPKASENNASGLPECASVEASIPQSSPTEKCIRAPRAPAQRAGAGANLSGASAFHVFLLDPPPFKPCGQSAVMRSTCRIRRSSGSPRRLVSNPAPSRSGSRRCTSLASSSARSVGTPASAATRTSMDLKLDREGDAVLQGEDRRDRGAAEGQGRSAQSQEAQADLGVRWRHLTAGDRLHYRSLTWAFCSNVMPVGPMCSR